MTLDNPIIFAGAAYLVGTGIGLAAFVIGLATERPQLGAFGWLIMFGCGVTAAAVALVAIVLLVFG
jgi:hypothetical protein